MRSMVTAAAPAEPVPSKLFVTVAARTLLVASLGGAALGGANGSLVGPVLGPLVGAVLGFAIGALTGAVSAAVAALVVRRRPRATARTVRLLVLLPALCVAGSSVLASGGLLLAGAGRGGDAAPFLAFGVAGPLALLLAATATPWCVGTVAPQLRRPRAGRRVLVVAVPIAVLAAGMVAWGLVGA